MRSLQDKLQRHNAQIECEPVESRAWCEEFESELKQMLEAAELERYRFIETEHVK